MDAFLYIPSEEQFRSVSKDRVFETILIFSTSQYLKEGDFPFDYVGCKYTANSERFQVKIFIDIVFKVSYKFLFILIKVFFEFHIDIL